MPAAVEWESEYTNSKKLCVEVVAACGREDLALALADTHGYPEGTVAICHNAEGREVRTGKWWWWWWFLWSNAR